jgi:signal transduction histidine kinase/CheY-like chemotaxis protein
LYTKITIPNGPKFYFGLAKQGTSKVEQRLRKIAYMAYSKLPESTWPGSFPKTRYIFATKFSQTYLFLAVYPFKVFGAGTDAAKSNQLKMLFMNILTPFWPESWFTMLIIFIIVAGASGFYLYKIRFIKRQKLKLEKMVRERTWKVRKQANNLQKLNLELQAQSEQFQAQSRELLLQSKALKAQSEALQIQSEELILKTKSLELVNKELIQQKEEERKARLMAEMAQQQADKANLAKSTFLATMSHEIRTPINGVLGMASLLIETNLDAEQQNYTEAILNSGESLLNVINDVLDFSKIESGNLELDYHTFEPRKCVEDVLELFGAKIADSGIDLIYQIDDQVPLYVIADSHRLRQVLINMVGNAIKFTKQGEVFIGVSAKPISEEQLEIGFLVRDTGIGIPVSQLDNLFKAFNQLDSSVTRKYGGTGLGLVICERLVNLMGGSIEVESRESEGTSFTFSIICKKAAAPFLAAKLPDEPIFVGKTVLIVEDNATSLKVLAHQLEHWKLNILPASSGQQALKILSEHSQIDLVITDMQMPAMNGVTLSKQIKSLNSNVPIILLNSIGNESSKINPDLFSSVLTKPVKYHQLFDAVKSALKNETAANMEQRKTHLSVAFASEYPFSILVAEDIVMNQKLIMWVLSKLGYKPDLANNGVEVLAMLAKQSYDVILMDIQMPQMDGLEATRIIRQTYGAKPLIMAMTANALSEDRENCFRAGVDDYISKPINLDLLTKSLKELYNRQDSSITQ